MQKFIDNFKICKEEQILLDFVKNNGVKIFIVLNKDKSIYKMIKQKSQNSYVNMDELFDEKCDISDDKNITSLIKFNVHHYCVMKSYWYTFYYVSLHYKKHIDNMFNSETTNFKFKDPELKELFFDSFREYSYKNNTSTIISQLYEKLSRFSRYSKEKMKEVQNEVIMLLILICNFIKFDNCNFKTDTVFNYQRYGSELQKEKMKNRNHVTGIINYLFTTYGTILRKNKNHKEIYDSVVIPSIKILITKHYFKNNIVRYNDIEYNIGVLAHSLVTSIEKTFILLLINDHYDYYNKHDDFDDSYYYENVGEIELYHILPNNYDTIIKMVVNEIGHYRALEILDRFMKSSKKKSSLFTTVSNKIKEDIKKIPSEIFSLMVLISDDYYKIR